MKLIIVSILSFIIVSVHAQEACVLSPTALSIHEQTIYIAHKTGMRVDLLDKNTEKLIHSIAMQEAPNGVIVHEGILYITSSHGEGYLSAYNLKDYTQIFRKAVGMGACAPTLSQDGKTLYICNRFKNKLTFFDLKKQEIISQISMLREPCSAVLSKDGSTLFVANFLPQQRADLDVVAAAVSVVDVKKKKLIKNILLENGSNALRGMALSPDGQFVLVSHNLGRFQVPTSQLQQGWMNTSAFSVINTSSLSFEGAVLLDEPESGAAGVWGIACADDMIAITHSGTHEFSLISYPHFVEKFNATKDKSELAYQLSFLTGIRKRIALEGNGPRALVADGKQLFIACYFTDQINVYDREHHNKHVIELNPHFEESLARQGERYFNDASLCFQSWQSCNGCHPGEARTDGLNWDLLNDGIGNPKNCKSMLYAHQTAPAMITGIRANAEVAVRAGFKHIQFAEVSEEHSLAVDAYLKSLRPLPSPFLIDGELSPLAKEGEKVFYRLQCNTCHSGPLFTDMQMYKIGHTEFDAGWDTPTLIEVWRTAPYLFDGRAEDLHALFGTHAHGVEEVLKPKELDALVEYVNSL